MPHASELRLLVLHGLRLKGIAEPPAVAGHFGLDEAAVVAELGALEGEGLVLRRDGRLAGFTLTAEGRAAGASLLRDELDAAGARAEVQQAYERFKRYNDELIAICTAWQMRTVGGTPQLNDHTDQAYDAAVVKRLVALHDAVRPVLVSLREQLDRYAGHGVRLRAALEKLVGGDQRYFTKPMFPSYHTIWFELHEDLLATLGIDRSTEGAHR